MTGFERRVCAAEEEIRRLPRERVYIFDTDGSILFQAEGREDTVFIPGPPAHDRLVVHNHANGESLSRRDVQVLIEVQAAEFHVITERYRFGLRLPQGARWRDIERLVNELYFEELEDANDRVRARTTTVEAAAREVTHRLWVRIAGMFGWDYRREVFDT